MLLTRVRNREAAVTASWFSAAKQELPVAQATYTSGPTLPNSGESACLKPAAALAERSRRRVDGGGNAMFGAGRYSPGFPPLLFTALLGRAAAADVVRPLAWRG